MEVNTSELIGNALDWAVATARELEVRIDGDSIQAWLLDKTSGDPLVLVYYRPSKNWSQGGPIIEQEKMTVGLCIGDTQWAADIYEGSGLEIRASKTGPTPLIAAMRCYVASKFGDKVDIPEELL
jgi:hypothetical protein